VDLDTVAGATYSISKTPDSISKSGSDPRRSSGGAGKDQSLVT
jgi:hypothetical protein